MTLYKLLDTANKDILKEIFSTKKIMHILYAPKSILVIDVQLLDISNNLQKDLFDRCKKINIQYVFGKVTDFHLHKSCTINIIINDNRLLNFHPCITLQSEQVLVICSRMVEKYCK